MYAHEPPSTHTNLCDRPQRHGEQGYRRHQPPETGISCFSSTRIQAHAIAHNKPRCGQQKYLITHRLAPVSFHKTSVWNTYPHLSASSRSRARTVSLTRLHVLSLFLAFSVLFPLPCPSSPKSPLASRILGFSCSNEHIMSSLPCPADSSSSECNPLYFWGTAGDASLIISPPISTPDIPLTVVSPCVFFWKLMTVGKSNDCDHGPYSNIE